MLTQTDTICFRNHFLCCKPPPSPSSAHAPMLIFPHVMLHDVMLHDGQGMTVISSIRRKATALMARATPSRGTRLGRHRALRYDYDHHHPTQPSSPSSITITLYFVDDRAHYAHAHTHTRTHTHAHIHTLTHSLTQVPVGPGHPLWRHRQGAHMANVHSNRDRRPQPMVNGDEKCLGKMIHHEEKGIE